MPLVVPSLDAIPFPVLIDFHNKHNHGSTYAILSPPAPSDSPKLTVVTWGDFFQAVTRGAHLVNPLTPDGVPSRMGRVIAVLAVADSLVYQALVLAIVRSGNVAFPISHRNSTAAVVNLLRKTSCHEVIFGGASVRPLLEETLNELQGTSHRVDVIRVPEAAQLFPGLGKYTESPGELVSHYPDPPSLHSLDDVRVYMHSSGTTSLPKPIPLDERYMRFIGNCPTVQDLRTTRLHAAMASPPFHLMGFITQLILPLTFGVPIALWTVSTETNAVPPISTPQNTIEAMALSGCTTTLNAPSFLVGWARENHSVNYLRQMTHVITGSGPMPEEVGDYLVRQGVNVVSCYGGTEFGLVTTVERIEGTVNEWAWLEFGPSMPLRWSRHGEGEDALYELQILATDTCRPGILNTDTPDGRAYSTNDIFVPHPTKRNMYKIVGRLDDQVTLATGEKVNPGPIETALTESPLVLGAVVVGRGRDQIGVIVEIAKGHEIDIADSVAIAKFRNAIWPVIETINHQSAGFARLFKEAVIPSSSQKPFPRTPKGTVQRTRAIELYDKEIEDMYGAIDKAQGGESNSQPLAWTTEYLVPWVGDIVEELLERRIATDGDVFNHGGDSLTATFLRNRIIGAMRNSNDTSVSRRADDVDQDIVFSHPTILSLARRITSMVHAAYQDPEFPVERRVRNMHVLLERYTTNIPSLPPSTSRPPDREIVLVTGTTGALGSLILARLLADNHADKIWALNRSNPKRNLAQRQRDSFARHGMDPTLLNSSKLRLVEVDLCADLMGLDATLYTEISSNVTLVIHNSWRLDFNLSVKSFEPHIKGTRGLVDLALRSPQFRSIRFVFISSISVVLAWKDRSTWVPEESIEDASLSVGTGYGESKYITEKLLETVSHKTGLSTTVIRLGQLSGSENGCWSPTDWVPNLIFSSVSLGCLPDARGVVSWVPLDSAASSIIDPVPWTTIMNGVADGLTTTIGGGRRLPIVPWSEWLARLEAQSSAGDSHSSIARIPALKLLPFYRRLAASDTAVRESERATHGSSEVEAVGFVRIATDKMQALSPTLRNLAPMDADHPKRWIAYWHSRGLFDSHIHSNSHPQNSTHNPTVPVSAVASSKPDDVMPIAATTATESEIGAASPAKWRNSVFSFISTYLTRLLYSFRP